MGEKDVIDIIMVTSVRFFSKYISVQIIFNTFKNMQY